MARYIATSLTCDHYQESGVSVMNLDTYRERWYPFYWKEVPYTDEELNAFMKSKGWKVIDHGWMGEDGECGVSAEVVRL